MKTTILVILLTLLIGIILFARDISYTGCTKDHKIVELAVAIADDAPNSVDVSVRSAFTHAAEALTADVLLSGEGFRVFAAGLTDADKAAITIVGPPVVLDGACTP